MYVYIYMYIYVDICIYVYIYIYFIYIYIYILRSNVSPDFQGNIENKLRSSFISLIVSLIQA